MSLGSYKMQQKMVTTIRACSGTWVLTFGRVSNFLIFNLFLPKALALAAQKQFQASVLECLKSATSKVIAAKHRRDESLWLKTMSISMPSVEDTFRRIIEQTSKHGGWDLIGQGFSFWQTECINSAKIAVSYTSELSSFVF